MCQQVIDSSKPLYVILVSAILLLLIYLTPFPHTVFAFNTDKIAGDEAGVVVNPIALVTTETGGTDSIFIMLNTEPTDPVTVTLTSNDLSEGTVAPTLVVFDDTDWNTPKTVTVTGVDDDIDDGDVAYMVITSDAVSADPEYDGLSAADVSATNLDDDVAGVSVNPTSGLVTTEAGGTDTFAIVLESEPIATVMITLSSNDTSEGTVAPAAVVFDISNWDAPQIITVTGVDDVSNDGDIDYLINTTASSVDPNYNGIAVANVSVTNKDDEQGDGFVSFLPILIAPYLMEEMEPNNSIAEANGPIGSNMVVSGAFPNGSDSRDYFYFDHATSGLIVATLTNIPQTGDYDLALRNGNGDLLGFSGNPDSADEHISVSLPPGRYYLDVIRGTGSSSNPYTLLVVYD